MSPPSHCPSCKTPIRWYDNIPVVSYVVLGGRCRTCGQAISVRYPLVELVTAGAFVTQGLVFGHDPSLLWTRIVFTALLVALFGTDLETQRLPNVLTLPGLAVGLLASIWVPPGFVSSVIGAGLGALVLLLIRWIWRRATGVDAMGLGDVKMLAMIGAFLGWQQVWVVLFLSSITGAALGIALAARRGRSLQMRLPFGTFLAAAAYMASLVGTPLLAWYLDLFR